MREKRKRAIGKKRETKGKRRDRRDYVVIQRDKGGLLCYLFVKFKL